MMEYTYNSSEKPKCWYKDICDHSRCGSNFCIRHYKMDCLMSMGCLEGQQRYPVPLRLDKDGTDRDVFIQLKGIQQNINEFVTGGSNLIIYSEFTGNGKTEWAKKLLFSWFNEIWPSTELECRGLFISMPKLLSALKDNISMSNEYFQYIKENIVKADLVIWDELNFKDLSAFEHDFMLNILDQRISIGKANVYTTNYPLDVTAKKLGSRLSSRIIGKSIKIELKGKDKRGLEVR